MKSSPNNNNRLAAAQDLINKLDNALLTMNNSTLSAAEDAAKARRNAKAAGEVARRYGGGTKKKKKILTANNSNKGDALLEKKREKRVAARMAAEVRLRKEHPYVKNYSSSPLRPSSIVARRGFMATTGGGGSPRRLVLQNDDNNGDNIAHNNMNMEWTENFNDNTNIEKNGLQHSAKAPMATDIDIDNRERVLSKGSSTVFEDAMDEHPHHDEAEEGKHEHEDGHDNNNVVVIEGEEQEDGLHPLAAQEQQQQKGVEYMEEEKEKEESSSTAALQAPPVNNKYYNGQTSFYNSSSGDTQIGGDDGDVGSQGQTHVQMEEQPTTSTTTTLLTTPTKHQQQQKQQHSTTTPLSSSSSRQHRSTSTPMSTSKIEASHAEDVLTLNLELQRVRAQLSSTTNQLVHATEQISTLQGQNDNLKVELTNNINSTQVVVSTIQQQLEYEQRKSKAAEEDATLALELAKSAQSTKEECEMWLSRSLDEIDLWKGRYMELLEKKKLMVATASSTTSSSMVDMDHDDDDDMANNNDHLQNRDQSQKSVRFKEDCPPSPVVSEDGTFGSSMDEEEEEDSSSPLLESKLAPTPLPPPPPNTPATNDKAVWTTPVLVKEYGSSSTLSGVINNTTSGSSNSEMIHQLQKTGGLMFSPSSSSSSDGAAATTPSSKEAAIAAGRAYLYRALSPPQSASSSISPYKHHNDHLSPHPRVQASELLKKSAETRRLLRERLTPGRHGKKLARPPTNAVAAALVQNTTYTDNSSTSNQGAVRAVKSVKKMILESGSRLKLKGVWWSNKAAFLLANSSCSIRVGGGGGDEMNVDELDQMVKIYCHSVERTIGVQSVKIDELLAFCDHLENQVQIFPLDR